MPYLGMLGVRISKTTVISEISTLEFCRLQNFVKKQKYLNLGSKMFYFGIFGLKFENNILPYLKSTSSNLSNCRISWNSENVIISEWKCLILVLKMPYLGVFGLEF